MTTEAKQNIREVVKGKVIYNEPLKKHASFRIGGRADIWIEPEDIEDIQSCLRLSKAKDIPISIIGGGTNLLVNDEGIRGIVINMQSSSLKYIYHGNRRISVTSSVTLRELLRSCIAKGFGGLEFLAGIPGTVGGAIATNAGSRHYRRTDEWKDIGNFIDEIRIMDYNGRINTLTKNELNFNYKSAGLGHVIILEPRFLLTKASSDSILREHQNFLRRKKMTQELSMPSAGCIFKNPAGFKASAGELIDRCGLKGRRVGGAVVSKRHANFILNNGNALAKDVIALIETIRSEVKKKFGTELSLEIKIV